MTEQLPGMESERRKPELSQWFTPPDLAERIAEWATSVLANGTQRVLEPSCGRGALVLPLLRARCSVVGIDIDSANVNHLEQHRVLGVCTYWCGDFLEFRPHSVSPFDMVVMNPPFEDGAAEAHVLHALKFAPRVVAHVPLTTLEGKKRREGLWSEAYLKRVAICSSRPKYGAAGGATAMCTIDVVRRPEGKVAMNGTVAACGVEIEWWS
jgi:predicted RNA methylase